MLLIFTLMVIVAAAILTARGFDVRLILMSAALLLGGVSGHLPAVVREFFNTFSSEKFVIPICCAMGFAYVIKHTGCDTQLVRLLIAPVRRVQFLIVPAVIFAGFLINIPVLSQTSVAVCLGAVVVPLMRAAGFSMPTIGATLLLGSSVGGELFNQGAPELITVSKKTGASTVELSRNYLPQLVLPMLAISMIAFWILTRYWEKRAKSVETVPLPTDSEPINLLKAAVPLVPVLFLMVTSLPVDWLHIPSEYLAVATDEVPKPEKLQSGRLVGLSMLIGMVAAAAVSPKQSGACLRVFFEGAGYGFTNVISLIVAAVCFGEAIKNAGVADALGQLIKMQPGLLTPLAIFVPWAFAAVSGSGMASTASLYGFFYDPAIEHGANPNDVGALVSVGSAAGRTMSPVAAVAIMCGRLSDSSPWVLVGRVAIPLGIGLMGVMILRMCGVV